MLGIRIRRKTFLSFGIAQHVGVNIKCFAILLALEIEHEIFLSVTYVQGVFGVCNHVFTHIGSYPFEQCDIFGWLTCYFIAFLCIL